MKKKDKQKRSRFVSILIVVFFITQILPFFYKAEFTIPKTNLTVSSDQLSFAKRFLRQTKASPFLNASDTLSNSRLSYLASVASGTSGSSVVTIDTGSADKNTYHLFPNDAVCISGSLLDGCQNRSTYTVANIGVGSTTVFNLTSPLTASLMTNDYVIASQSARHTITFTLPSTVSIGNDLLITVPASSTDARTNDGMPDTGTVSTSGFDLNTVATANVGIGSSAGAGGCTNADWGSATVIDGTGATGHLFRFDRVTSTCATGSIITVTIGDATDTTKQLVNPAPITSHTQGTADTYQINIKHRDVSDNTIDSSDVAVAPIEAVLVSATVDEILNFSVASQGVGTTRCGQVMDVATTAYSVPWGTISTVNSFLEAAQLLTVSTNADGGYAVRIEENDQMGKNGIACSGAAADYTDNCIQDTLCGATPCSESAGRYWTTAATYPGLGISMEDLSGTDATWVYDSTSEPCTTTGGGTSTNFCARQIADQEASETKASIMSNADQVNSSTSYVCYRIAITGLQPAGYYQNKVKYTATATF